MAYGFSISAITRIVRLHFTHSKESAPHNLRVSTPRTAVARIARPPTGASIGVQSAAPADGQRTDHNTRATPCFPIPSVSCSLTHSACRKYVAKIQWTAPLQSWRSTLSDPMNIKPRVLIMIATEQIGGPGKGVLQFLEHAPAGTFEYVLCNFDPKNHPVGQFVHEARRRKLNLRLLKQRVTLDPHLIIQARRVIREHDINLIQTHVYKASTIGFFLKLFCRLPWIGFAHGFIEESRKLRFYNRIDRLVLRRADRIVAVSNSMKALSRCVKPSRRSRIRRASQSWPLT